MQQSSGDWGRRRRDASRATLLGPEQERGLISRAQRDDKRAVAELVATHMRLVVSIAARYARGGLSPHDLVAEGTVGLLESIQRYDCMRETRFASYAVFWIRARISRFALANRRIVGAPSTRAGRKAQARLRSVERSLAQQLGRWPNRLELAQALEVDEEEIQALEGAGQDVSLGESTAEPSDERFCPEALVADAELIRQRQSSVTQALSQLNQRESSIVRQHMAEEARSLAELARELGISRQRTGQIMAHAREKLRPQLEQVA